MSNIKYLDDLISEFCTKYMFDDDIDDKDKSVLDSIFINACRGNYYTRAQAGLVTKILKKYPVKLSFIDKNYEKILENQTWKNNFRILNQSRELKLEITPEGEIFCSLIFPFSFKETFDKRFLDRFNLSSYRIWDAENKCNKISFFVINPVLLLEFCLENSFTIDDNFINACLEVENIWENERFFSPRCIIDNDKVKLINANEDSLDYWNKNSKNSKNFDLLLAKFMGFHLEPDYYSSDIFEKINKNVENTYWCREIDTFLQIHKTLDDLTVIILDRSDNILAWLENFIHCCDQHLISRSDIKVCFRDESKENTKLNHWIKENSLGGNISGGKIFIFRQKLPKWLLKNEKSVKLVGTNGIFPITNRVTSSWMENHPCVMYIGPIKASQIKDKKIVEL